MSVVHWVPELEGEHRVRPHLLEAFAELGRGQSGCICGKQWEKILFFCEFGKTRLFYFLVRCLQTLSGGHHDKTVFAKKNHGIAGTSFPGVYKY